ncbi:MAG TPA: pilus assembly protein TadG-related protein, partial [Pseudorhizobium sp.]|nr:pilus assembly protein TadG-related protein [Pseudorhizobium sp.]
MRAVFNRLWSEKSGNFGIMTALLAVPLTGAAGLAIDLTHALSLRTQLYAAADAAAVGAITANSPAVAEAIAMQGDGAVTVGSPDGQKLFLGQMAGELEDLPLEIQVTVTKTAGVIESHVSFNAIMPTTFMKVLGHESVTIGGAATARYQTPAFMDFYMLLDNTPSMGVAATPKDIAKLKHETRFGYQGPDPKRKGSDKNCAFACH